jgi:hypothetical protein
LRCSGRRIFISAECAQCPAQGPLTAPLRTLGAPRRPGQREKLTCQVSLLSSRAHLTAPVIGKRAGLIWMHVILPPWPPKEIAFSQRLFPRFSVARAL